MHTRNRPSPLRLCALCALAFFAGVGFASLIGNALSRKKIDSGSFEGALHRLGMNNQKSRPPVKAAAPSNPARQFYDQGHAAGFRGFDVNRLSREPSGRELRSFLSGLIDGAKERHLRFFGGSDLDITYEFNGVVANDIDGLFRNICAIRAEGSYYITVRIATPPAR